MKKHTYFLSLSDEEIEQRISRLPPNQKKEFDRAITLDPEEDRRRALFIASSYSME